MCMYRTGARDMPERDRESEGEMKARNLIVSSWILYFLSSWAASVQKFTSTMGSNSFNEFRCPDLHGNEGLRRNP